MINIQPILTAIKTELDIEYRFDSDVVLVKLKSGGMELWFTLAYDKNMTSSKDGDWNRVKFTPEEIHSIHLYKKNTELDITDEQLQELSDALDNEILTDKYIKTL